MRSPPGSDGVRGLAIAALVVASATLTVGAADGPRLSTLTGPVLAFDVLLVVAGFAATSALVVRSRRDAAGAAPSPVVRALRRLLPALVVLVAACLVATALLQRGELVGVRDAGLAGLAQVANWTLPGAGDTSDLPLLEHLWVLSLGAQVLLAWSLLVWLARRPSAAALRRRLPLVAAAGAVLSAAAMAVPAVVRDVPADEDAARLLLGTDTHAFPVLLGATAALVWTPTRLSSMRRRGQARLLDALGLVAVAILGWAVVRVDATSTGLYVGGALGVAAATVVVLVAAHHPRTLLGRLLRAAPLLWVGARAYGLFLWSWPVVVLTGPGTELPLRSWPLVALRLVVTVALAAASYHLVERPLLQGRSAPDPAAVHGPPREWRRAVTAVSTAVLLTTGVGMAAGSAAARTAQVPQPSELPAAAPLGSAVPAAVPTAAPTAAPTRGTGGRADSAAAPADQQPVAETAPPDPSRTPTRTPTPEPPPPAPAPPPPPAPPAPSPDCAVLACVALTFDDGPGPSTADLVRILQERGATATFFMIGRMVRADPGAARAVADAGFEVGNHSDGHPRLTQQRDGAVVDQLTAGTAAVEAATGRRPVLFRPPYGLTDARVAAAAAALGQAQVLWDADPSDWALDDPAVVTQRVLARTTPGSIVLLHDIEPATVAAVPAIVDGLRAAGYTFVTVSQLLGPGLVPGQTYLRR